MKQGNPDPATANLGKDIHMRLGIRLLALVLICGCLAPMSQVNAQSAPLAISLEEYAAGLESPVAISHAGDGSGRLYVVEQAGTIAVVEDGQVSETRMLDIVDRVESGGSEQGLLGLAFAPDFATSLLFYVMYTDLDGNEVVSRFTAGEDFVSADPESEEILIYQEDFAENHNGGQLAFGPDGFLYIGLGDGGGGGDPEENGQDLSTLLGKILRIDVDPANATGDEPYAIPADNPFVDTADAAPEIWAYGLRNPWRFSFDTETGDLYIGDVGQGEIEEIDFAPAGEGGQNYGWNLMEGESCYAVEACDPEADDLTLPIAQYTHAEGGCSVTGGYVYRGDVHADLVGTYFYGDYCSGLIWGATMDTDGSFAVSEPYESGLRISTFGEGEDGAVYLADLTNGTIYELVAA
jgi:glucose/arabinose dehydrogenase